MPVTVIDTLKPKNNGSFPIVEAVDVAVSEDLRLSEALEAKADASALAATDAAVATKADKTDILSVTKKIEDFIENGYMTPQMFGAKGDGETDDTAAIQAALNSSSFVFIPDGTYMINATYAGHSDKENGGIKPNSGQTIILSPNAKLKAIANSTSFYQIVNLFQVKDVSIFGGKIEGDREYHEGTTGEHGHGIVIRACDNITIEGIEVFNCWGDSVDVAYHEEINSSNIRVYNCNLHDSRRQGISITGVDNMVVRDCEIYNISGTNPQFGIDIEPDGAIGFAKNIVIDSCKIINNVGGAIVVADVDNEIKNVKIENCTTDGVFYCYTCDGLTLDSNIIEHLYLGTKNSIVSNCDIEALLPNGGSGVFNTCRFKSETTSGLIVENTSGYPEKISEYLTFSNCAFAIVKSNQCLYNGKTPSGGYIDNTFINNTVKFIDCNIDLIGTESKLFNQAPKEINIEGCTINFQTNPYEAFSLKNTPTGVKLSIHNTIVASVGIIPYIIGVSSHLNYEIEIYNSRFTDSKNFLYCAPDGGSGGRIILFNNQMSNTNIYNNNAFIMTMANSIPTKTSDLYNDSGYLTNFTETDPTVPSWAKETTKPSYTKSEIGLENVDNERQYSVSNPPPYPVSSVNGQTGEVSISIPTKTSSLENDSGFLTDIPNEYITEEKLNEKNYANKSGAEIWTFTLDDGTTITKKVVLA